MGATNVRRTANIHTEEQNQNEGRNHGSNSQNNPMNMQLTTTTLTGRNYLSWSRSVRIALRAKRKFGFVDGTRAKPANDSPQLEQWIRSDCKVRSWLLNSISKELVDAFIYTASAKDLWDELKKRYGKSNGPLLYQTQREVNTMSQGTMSVEQYFTKMKGVWDELICLMPLPTCTCEAAKEVSEFTETTKLMQFLTGLNDAYDNIKSQILVAEPLPSVHRAYTLVMRIEKQNEMNDSFNSQNEAGRNYESGRGGNVGDNWSGRNNHDGWSNRNSQNNWNGRNNPGEGTSKRNNNYDKKSKYCNYCRKTGHLEDKCFEKNGYPDRNGRNNPGKVTSKGNKNYDKRSKYCNYCRKTGHLEDKCFEKHGYPDFYKSLKDKKAKQSGGGKLAANISESTFDADIGNDEDKYNNNTKIIANIKDIHTFLTGSSSSRRKEEINWEDFAPTVEDYNSDLAKAIAGGTGQIVKVCSNAYTNQVQKVGENVLLLAVEGKNWRKTSRRKNANGPKKLGAINKSPKRHLIGINFYYFLTSERYMYSVRKLLQTTEKVSKAMLDVVGEPRGSVTARVVPSRASKEILNMEPGGIISALLDAVGKAILHMVPGGIVLALLDAVGKAILHMVPGGIVSALLDAVVMVIRHRVSGGILSLLLDAVDILRDIAEAARKQAVTVCSSAVTRMVYNRYGESAGEATKNVLTTAGHVAGTAWNVFKIIEAINHHHQVCL